MAVGSKNSITPSNTLFIRKLPQDTSESTLREAYGDVGAIRQCFIVKKKDGGSSAGVGFVTFVKREDAEKALKKVVILNNEKVIAMFADPSRKHKKGNSSANNASQPEKNDVLPETTGKKKLSTTVVISRAGGDATVESIKKTLKSLHLIKLASEVEVIGESADEKKFHICSSSKKNALELCRKLRGFQIGGSTPEVRLLSQEKSMLAPKFLKQTRLIIRNLAFKCSAEDLKKAFSKFGSISEVVLPKKADGKACGFGFIQYSNVSEAKQAIEVMNGKQIDGRPVAVDWAVPKFKFQQNDENATSVKKGGDAGESDEEEEANDDGDDDSEEDGSEEEEEEKVSKTNAKAKQNGKDSDSDVADDDDDDEEDDDEEEVDEGDSDGDHDDMEQDDEDSDKKPVKDKRIPDKEKKRIQCVAVDEGSTLFIRNLSFDTDEDTLTEELSQFGSINYCKIVVDRNTERSKGMAFVQFTSKQDADQCLAANDAEGIIVDGRRLNMATAVSRDKARQLVDEKKTPLHKEKQRTRNLHLAREGMIRAGTKAAEGVSKEDMDKRTKMEMQKRDKLKDPNILISDTRLSIHNLPTSVDDKQLRQLCMKHCTEPGAKIIECRVMRDLAKVNSQGVGKSKGYAFVNFTRHDHAMSVLRHLNNNADCFGPSKRPIVEFSLENARILQSKQKRLERAKSKQEQTTQGSGGFARGPAPGAQKLWMKSAATASKPSSAGIQKTPAPPGANKGGQKAKPMPTHFGPKIRHRDRGQQAIVKKKPAKVESKAEKMKRRREYADVHGKLAPKRMKQEVRDDFDKLVKTYQHRLSTAIDSSRGASKWFD